MYFFFQDKFDRGYSIVLDYVYIYCPTWVIVMYIFFITSLYI